MPEYINDDIEISSDGYKGEYSYEENIDKENYDEENSDEENFNEKKLSIECVQFLCF